MAKPKINLDEPVSPTFKCKVGIPIPGGAPVLVEFTFKYRDADEYEDWRKTLPGLDEPDVMMDIASAWDLADPFSRDNIEKLLKKYMGSGMAIFNKYVAENTGAKLGN